MKSSIFSGWSYQSQITAQRVDLQSEVVNLIQSVGRGVEHHPSRRSSRQRIETHRYTHPWPETVDSKKKLGGGWPTSAIRVCSKLLLQKEPVRLRPKP
jgi:hypothetical protein